MKWAFIILILGAMIFCCTTLFGPKPNRDFTSVRALKVYPGGHTMPMKKDEPFLIAPLAEGPNDVNLVYPQYRMTFVYKGISLSTPLFILTDNRAVQGTVGDITVYNAGE